MQDQAIPYEKKAGALSHAFVLDGYRERGESREMTGEWIVYAPSGRELLFDPWNTRR
jgi:hypothetical protein